MKSYLKDLLSRVSEHSKTLDKLSELQDYPWVTISENGEKEKYIFRRNGSLIISKNGNVEMGRWEFLTRAESLLVSTSSGKRLLNHGFLDDNALVLIEDGTDEVLMFANQAKLSSLDPKGYLMHLNKPKRRQIERRPEPRFIEEKKPARISNGQDLEYKLDYRTTLIVHTEKGLQSEKGCPATINDKPAPDGEYRISAFQSIKVKDGKTV